MSTGENKVVPLEKQRLCSQCCKAFAFPDKFDSLSDYTLCIWCVIYNNRHKYGFYNNCYYYNSICCSQNLYEAYGRMLSNDLSLTFTSGNGIRLCNLCECLFCDVHMNSHKHSVSSEASLLLPKCVQSTRKF